MLFRRGSCEGSLPIGGVVSTSTLTLVGVSFLCSPGSDVAAVSLADLGERFNGVSRDNPSDQTQVRLCTRVGSDDVLRTISMEGADIVDTGGAATTFADLEEHDLLQIDGFRSGPGSSFVFDTQRVQVKEHNVTDECAGV